MSKNNIHNVCKDICLEFNTQDGGDGDKKGRGMHFSDEAKGCLQQFLSQIMLPTVRGTLDKTVEIEGKHRVTPEIVKRSVLVMHGEDIGSNIATYIEESLQTYESNRQKLLKEKPKPREEKEKDPLPTPPPPPPPSLVTDPVKEKGLEPEDLDKILKMMQSEKDSGSESSIDVSDISIDEDSSENK